MAKKKRTIVGSPLTPEMLLQLGAVSDFSPAEKPFAPAGQWTCRYRIWACHGYRESGNTDVGFLQIQRTSTGTDKRFELGILQEIKNEGGTLNRVTATIDCIEGDLSYPVQWSYASVILDADGKEDKALTVQIKGQSSDSEVQWTRNGVLSKMACGRRPSCDWCVYETVQRNAKQLSGLLMFDMLESLERFKPDQQLIGRGLVQLKAGGSHGSLYRFDHLGAGILPFEYWVDQSSRLRLMTSADKAYLLDTESSQGEHTEAKRKGIQ